MASLHNMCNKHPVQSGTHWTCDYHRARENTYYISISANKAKYKRVHVDIKKRAPVV